MRPGHPGVKRLWRRGGRTRCLNRPANPDIVRPIAPIPGAGATQFQGVTMAEKLGIGDAFPSLTLNLVSGGTMNIPGDMDSKYKVILFYRGHW